MPKKQPKTAINPLKRHPVSHRKIVVASKKKRPRRSATIRIKKKSAVIYSNTAWSESLLVYKQLIFNQIEKAIIEWQKLKSSYQKIYLPRWQKNLLTYRNKSTALFQKTQKSAEQGRTQFVLAKNRLTQRIKRLVSRKRPVGRPKRKRSLHRPLSSRIQILFMFVSLILTFGIFLATYETYNYVFKDLPSVDQLMTRKENLTTKILDRNGQLLYRIYKDQNRTLIPLSRIPPDMIHATIAIEDRNFYSHGGLSFRGIFRALHSDLSSDRLQGGSTITQQLVKNTLLGPERTLQRKLREAVLAVLVEHAYTKNEILEMYFNDVPYGGSTYGVEEAAQKYFGKTAFQLDLAESAFLAGLPAAPSVYSPFGPNPELAYSRQKEILNRMVEDKYITPEQASAAENEKLNFQANTNDIKAPHFVMYVKNLLEQEYGEDVVNQGGLSVRTTLDLDIQNQAQSIVTDELKSLARLRISNGAALVTNPKSGEILAMIGSKNYFDFASDGQVNVTTRPRQPGSSIKPVTYAVALEKGKNPSSTIVDAPVTFSIAGSPPYTPKNYDGRYHGVVTLRTALGSSFNIPAVKTLAEIGISSMIDKAQQMGITTWQDRKRFGLSLTLGSGEVLMTDMAQVYGTFANQGETVSLNPILEVNDYKGESLYRNTCALDNTNCPATRTLDSKVAYQITDILSDNNARIPAFGPRSVLYIPNQQVAVKTGTTNSLRDNWAFGYTTNRLVAVWVGNNDNQPMSYVASGVTGASPIWNKIMRTQLDDAHPHVFSIPSNLIKVKICAMTGTLPCAGCPNVTEEIFVAGTEPTQACSPSQVWPTPSPTNNPTHSPQPVPFGGKPPTPQAISPDRRNNRDINRILEGTSTQ